jgi:hypothetical protein
MARQPLVGLGLILEVLRSYSDTPRSVGLLWTSEQPISEIFTRQHTPLTTKTPTLAGFEPAIPSSERP